MTLILEWLRNDETLNVEFDAVPTITPEESATATVHPVERGADVTDHIQLAPRKLGFDAFVTNTPLKVPTTQATGVSGAVRAVDLKGHGGANVLQFDGKLDRPRQVYRLLRDAYLAKSMFRVYTAVEIYDDMVIIG